MRTTILPGLLAEEAFQALVQEEGTQPEASTLPDLRKQSTAFREAKAARSPGIQDQRKGSCTERGGLQRQSTLEICREFRLESPALFWMEK